MRHDEISRDSWLTQVTNKVHTSSRLPFRVKDATISSLFLKPINSKDSFDSFYPVKRTVHFQKEKKNILLILVFLKFILNWTSGNRYVLQARCEASSKHPSNWVILLPVGKFHFIPPDVLLKLCLPRVIAL